MNDTLTGLYDRPKFIDTLSELVRYAGEYSAPVGLLVIDVQRFHKINKNFGHSAGDVVLLAVADVLKNVCREDDFLARIGDDQFALLLSRVANVGHAQLAASKIQRLLEPPVRLEHREIQCAVVVGISLFPSYASDADTLLQTAEFALEQAKLKKEPVGVPVNKIEEEISEEWDIEVSLDQAIARSELRVFFQPKISLATGNPVGAEALVRWDSPTRGLVSPQVFLPMAETIGFMKPMTIWMLNSALRLSTDWTRKWGRLSVAVNIPPSILDQPDFTDLVLNADKLWERDNVDLCLEVVEESLVSDIEVAFKKLSLLRDHGIRISIDDFGTGYSSLSYFRDLPTDELKIDQSFIKGLKTDMSNIHIVSLIIEMAHRFGLQVIAEGVEDREIVSYLKKKKCDQVQGFYFAKPMPAEEFSDWLNAFKPITDESE